MLFSSEFNRIFGRVWSNFNSPVLDQRPSNYFKTEKGYVVVVKTLGISKEDIHVAVEKRKGSPFKVLKIEGKTSIEKLGIENSVSMGLNLCFSEEIEKLTFSCRDGLTLVTIETKEEKKPKLTAEYNEDAAFDI